MSNFGVFIFDPESDETPRRPRSKKEVKNTLPKFLYLEDTSFDTFPDKRFRGKRVMELQMLPDDSYDFVGPDPYTARKFYGQIVLAENGQVYVS